MLEAPWRSVPRMTRRWARTGCRCEGRAAIFVYGEGGRGPRGWGGEEVLGCSDAGILQEGGPAGDVTLPAYVTSHFLC